MGFEDIEIPDRLPDDVGPSITFFPLTREELKANGFLYFAMLKMVIEQPPGAQRTVGGIYKISFALSRLIQSIALVDVKRAQGIVVGLLRLIESQGLVRCDPPIDGETIWNPAMAMTAVTPAGLLLDPAVQQFIVKHAYPSVLWVAQGELSHALTSRLFPHP